MQKIYERSVVKILPQKENKCNRKKKKLDPDVFGFVVCMVYVSNFKIDKNK